jgi:hypothetical protein
MTMRNARSTADEPRIDLEELRTSLEQTEAGTVYLRVGPFDVRVSRAADRLKVGVYPFGSDGEALAECEACEADAASDGIAEVRHG